MSNAKPFMGTRAPAGIVVHELQVSDLTDAERRAFGFSDILPVEGLEQRNADLVPSRSTLYPFPEN